MKKIIPIILLFFLLLSFVSAVNLDAESITLLSIVEFENNTRVGGTAELTLKLQPGTGKIFLESYPAAKIDMQVATRLANEYACEYVDAPCEQYDFFYTVHSDSSIIGGPSGGGATTLLTIAVLEDIPLRDDVAMTGAIASGGILAPVSGVKEKIQAAEDAGFSLVIIPYLSLDTSDHKNDSNVTNATLDLLTTADLLNFTVDVAALLTVPEAFARATNTPLLDLNTSLDIKKSYSKTMQETSNLLCARTDLLFTQINEDQKNESTYVDALKFYNSSKQHMNSPYTKASFCFSANLPLQRLYLEQFSQEVLFQNSERLTLTIDRFREKVDSIPLVSFTDLETYAIVVERLLEAEEMLAVVNASNVSSFQLGYAIERYESAIAWSHFFGTDTAAIAIDDTTLHQACYKEIQSVETRLSYLNTIFPPQFLQLVQTNLAKAYDYSQNGDDALCLFKASKAKAHANLFFTTFGLQDGQLPFIIHAKQQAAYAVIEKQAPVFPLLGYSYTEYSEALQEEDEYSSLLFAEYGLVFSDVSGYFPLSKPGIVTKLFPNPRDVNYFIAGLLVGLLFILGFRKKPQKEIIVVEKP